MPQSPLQSWYCILLFVPVCNSLLHPFSRMLLLHASEMSLYWQQRLLPFITIRFYSGLLVEGEWCAGLYCGLVATIMFELLRHMSKEDKVLCTCWLGKIGKTGLRGSYLGHSLPFIDCPSFYWWINDSEIRRSLRSLNGQCSVKDESGPNELLDQQVTLTTNNWLTIKGRKSIDISDAKPTEVLQCL